MSIALAFIGGEREPMAYPIQSGSIAPDEILIDPSTFDAACQVSGKILSLMMSNKCPIIGINGAQGSGKSTFANLIDRNIISYYHRRSIILSLDDFYLTKTQRMDLGRLVHPLCATRGVPGTHDLPLLQHTLDALLESGPQSRTPIPQFDKLADDRLPETDWPIFSGRPDVILLEGWCVGVRGAHMPIWRGPINALEEEADPDGDWYHWSLNALVHDYERLWDRLSLLVSIEVPDLDAVIDSRLRQEEGLAGSSGRPRMDRAAVTRFVQHYERYTRALWASMPVSADMLFRRDRDYGFTLIKG